MNCRENYIYFAWKPKVFHAKIRCNLNDISYLSETHKNDFQFL